MSESTIQARNQCLVLLNSINFDRCYMYSVIYDSKASNKETVEEWLETLFTEPEFYKLTETLISEFLYLLLGIATSDPKKELSNDIYSLLIERQTLRSLMPMVSASINELPESILQALARKPEYDECNNRVRSFFKPLSTEKFMALSQSAPADNDPDLLHPLFAGIVEHTRWLSTISDIQMYDQMLDAQLLSTFKYPHFRPLQREICVAAHIGENLVAVLPTGYGKTLCFILPALMNRISTQNYMIKITVVISPLLALIKDQVKQMKILQLTAVSFGALQSEVAERSLINEIRKGKYNFVFITPEKLVMSGTVSKLLKYLAQQGMLSRFVIDEAHCISLYGPQFRRHYYQLSSVFRMFPEIPITGLTATCNDDMLEDIFRTMCRPYCLHFRVSMNRSNICLMVKACSSLSFFLFFFLHIFQYFPEAKMIEAAAKHIKAHPEDTGLVYCLSRKQCTETATAFNKVGITEHAIYHAGLSLSKRNLNQSGWSSGRIKFLIATSAFGLGINKPDVRFVLLLALPPSIFHYAQLIGRAGRDGAPALSSLMYTFNDRFRWYFLWAEERNRASYLVKFQNLWHIIHYAFNSEACRRVLLLNHFNEQFNSRNCSGVIPSHSHGCDNCSLRKTDPAMRDVNSIAIKVLEICHYWETKNIACGRSFYQLVSILSGSVKKDKFKDQNTATPNYGLLKGRKWNRDLVGLFLSLLLSKLIIFEENHENSVTGKNTESFITLGDQHWRCSSPKFARLFMALPKNVKIPIK